jgi:translation elongation factor EF-4
MARERGKKICQRLKEEIDTQQFDVLIEACIGKKVIVL